MTPRPSPLAVAAVVAACLGVCAIFAAVTVPAMIGDVSPWFLAAGGGGLLVLAVLVLWIVQRHRDRSLW